MISTPHLLNKRGQIRGADHGQRYGGTPRAICLDDAAARVRCTLPVLEVVGRCLGAHTGSAMRRPICTTSLLSRAPDAGNAMC